MKKTIVLCILDGYGFYKDYDGNAILNANTPFMDGLFKKYPWTEINASEGWVGLPVGQMGNSEVGHLNIGAGRIVNQPLVKITKAVENKTLEKEDTIKKVIAFAKEHNSNVHILGLLSDGGVHSHIKHIKGMANIMKEAGMNTYIHAFMDGRDTKSNIADTFIEEMSEFNIATISGRYYAMDRDKNFDRLQKTIDVMVENKGSHFSDPLEYVKNSLKNNVTDEFIIPAYNFKLNVKVKENDVMIMVNFRQDRANQIIAAFSGIDYEYKPKTPKVKMVSITKLANYTKSDIVFPLKKLDNTLGDWLSNNEYTQLRIAETEKYAHVTFFFDGGLDREIKNSDRILIPSPSVATYDLKPEMSLPEVTDALKLQIKSGKYDVIILNYANADMVGHTGNYEATIKATQSIDGGIESIYNALQEVKGTLIITADHGNAEEMKDENGNPKTSHTLNVIPFLITDTSVELEDSKTTALSGVAPAIIKYLGKKVPIEMTGKSIIKNIK